MRCFKCRAFVPDKTAICPHCDAILDTSFLEQEGSPTHEGPPPAPALPPPVVEQTWDHVEIDTDQNLLQAQTDTPASGQHLPQAAAFAEAPPVHQATHVLPSDPERDKKTRVVQAPPPPRLPPRHLREGEEAKGESLLSSDFDAAVDGLRQVYLRLHKAERISLWASLCAFVFSFMPWYYVKGTGLLSGIQTQGWIPAVLTFVAMALLYIRFAYRLGFLFSLGQFLSIACAAVVTTYYTLVPVLPNVRFGLPATALAACLAAVTGIAGLWSRTT